jgi:hypothetical protein
MPPACPADCYVVRRKERLERTPNATGLPGGSLRYSLQGTTPLDPKCHRLAQWIVTFLAVAALVRSKERETPPGKPVASKYSRGRDCM